MKEGKPKIHEGKIVSVTANEIISTCVEGDNHQHLLAKDANVTSDGKASKLDQLKVGAPVRVTTCTDDDRKASVVAAGRKRTVPYG